MLILGISAFYHDSAATLIENGKVLAAVQEERFSRVKNDANFPIQAIQYCLEHRGIGVKELDALVFYDKPLLKFERLLETYYAFAPKGFFSFLQAIPVWIKEKLFLKKIIRDELSKLGDFDRKKIPILFPDHHLSHAASAFYPSPFEEAAIVCLDGVGEWASTSIMKGKGKDIEVLKEVVFPHSLGLLYSSFTYFLGFRVNSGEYKLMGLAPYGNPESKQVARFREIIKDKLLHIYPDGSFYLNQDYFTYAYKLRMVDGKQWADLFGFPLRNPEEALEQKHCDLALAIQQVTEELIMLVAKEAKRLTGMENVCLAGGVALNCVANGKLQAAGIFKQVFIQPAAGDAGASLGAALAANHIYFKQERIQLGPEQKDHMQGALLGPAFSELEILKTARRYQASWKYETDEKLFERVANLIASGQVVGWFQGRMEFGPRALGNRSILGDARKLGMQEKINRKIKFRESFRPFAPAVLEEACPEYFALETDSPYMMLVSSLLPAKRAPLPDNYQELQMMDKLGVQRSELNAITHVDYSARIQTVNRATHPRFYRLIQAFQAQTACPMLINTSFNVRDEPIVCSPEDAYRCFIHTEMDVLVMGNYIFEKNENTKRYNQL